MDLDELRAPVAVYETNPMILAIVAPLNLNMEGCDLDNAHLIGNLDIKIMMERLTNSTGKV